MIKTKTIIISIMCVFLSLIMCTGLVYYTTNEVTNAPKEVVLAPVEYSKEQARSMLTSAVLNSQKFNKYSSTIVTKTYDDDGVEENRVNKYFEEKDGELFSYTTTTINGSFVASSEVLKIDGNYIALSIYNGNKIFFIRSAPSLPDLPSILADSINVVSGKFYNGVNYINLCIEDGGYPQYFEYVIKDGLIVSRQSGVVDLGNNVTTYETMTISYGEEVQTPENLYYPTSVAQIDEDGWEVDR